MSMVSMSPRIKAHPCAPNAHVNLFAGVAKDCRVVQVAGSDARARSDTWRDLESLILRCEGQYPRIEDWLDGTVRPGVESKRRKVFVGYHLGAPAVAAIVKVGHTSKFCHLSVSPELQQRNVGELFFALMAMSVRKESESLRFTLPEGLWEAQRSFFESFSFQHATPINKQYRLHERELVCEAPFTRVWPTVIKKLSKLRQSVSIEGIGWEQDLVMSIRPKHAESILELATRLSRFGGSSPPLAFRRRVQFMQAVRCKPL